MQQLSQVLPSIKSDAQQITHIPAISPMLLRGLTAAGGKMSQGQLVMASTPWQTAITIDRARQARQWLQRLKSCRKTNRTWEGKTLKIRTGYELPDNMREASIIRGLIDICRPCAPNVVAHFVRLQASKPFFDADEQRMSIVFECLYDDLKDYPEVAVIIGLDDLRTAPGKYWPETDEILSSVSEYRDTIFQALDFFKD